MSTADQTHVRSHPRGEALVAAERLVAKVINP
jgi:hypothetical protein